MPGGRRRPRRAGRVEALGGTPRGTSIGNRQGFDEIAANEVVGDRQSVVAVDSDHDDLVLEVGRADLKITKKDTSFDLFIPIEATTATMLAADERITAVHPRLEILVEWTKSGEPSQFGENESIWMIGLVSGVDDIGTLEVVEGNLNLGDDRVAVYEGRARNAGLEVGDVINAAYAITIPREPGKPESSGTSSSRQLMVPGAGPLILRTAMPSARETNSVRWKAPRLSDQRTVTSPVAKFVERA